MWKDELRELSKTKEYITESDIYDLVDKYPDDAKEIWQFIYELGAPKQCKGCKHVSLYGSFYPCNCCTRQENLKDFYET